MNRVFETSECEEFRILVQRIRKAREPNETLPQDWHSHLLARDSIICRPRYYAIDRPSVRLSVCHTGGSVKNG